MLKKQSMGHFTTHFMFNQNSLLGQVDFILWVYFHACFKKKKKVDLYLKTIIQNCAKFWWLSANFSQNKFSFFWNPFAVIQVIERFFFSPCGGWIKPCILALLIAHLTTLSGLSSTGKYRDGCLHWNCLPMLSRKTSVQSTSTPFSTTPNIEWLAMFI